MPPDNHAESRPTGASPLNGVVPPAEHRWKKGESGNPGGRPKGQSIVAALREALQREHNGRTIAELIAERLIKEALSGKFPFAKEVLDRADGKVTESHEVRVASWREAVKNMSDEDYIALAVKHGRLDLLPPRLQERAEHEGLAPSGEHEHGR